MKRRRRRGGGGGVVQSIKKYKGRHTARVLMNLSRLSVRLHSTRER